MVTSSIALEPFPAATAADQAISFSTPFPPPPPTPGSQLDPASPGTATGSSGTVQDRRASTSTSASSLHRRLSKSFQESELPLGFLAATAGMSSSMYAAARSRSGTLRTRASSTSEREERTRAPSLQPPPMLVEAAGEDHARASVSNDESHYDKAFAGVKAEPAEVVLVEQKDDGETVETLRSYGATRPGGSGGSSSGGVSTGETVSGGQPAVCAKTMGVRDGGAIEAGDDDDEEYENGYHFPPRYTRKESLQHGLTAFWNYARTPMGFVVVLYGCNVVAWGGMLFLLLCQASPAMCHPSCSDINSARRIWIEYDSQIVNALFCLTGFGLAPWRFRDLYYLLRFRIGHDPLALRRLAGIHRGWFRLAGSETLPPKLGPADTAAITAIVDAAAEGPDPRSVPIPFPESKMPDAPLTGVRAPPTRLWVVDCVIWMMVANTLLQCVLSGFMWGMNRYRRPSWSTGLFVALGCIAGAVGGLGMFFEGKRIKSIEGVPLTAEDHERLARDRTQGIIHYNNINDKKPIPKLPREKGGHGDLEAGLAT